MGSIPIWGSRFNDVIKQHKAKQERESAKNQNMRKESCEHCGKHSSKLGYELQQCRRCLAAYYCSRECQIAEWKKKHKWECAEREKQGGLVLGEAVDFPEGCGSKNFSTNKKQYQLRYGPPKSYKCNETFRVKVESSRVEGKLFVSDKSRYCCFYLAPESAGHKELTEKVAQEKTVDGKKSFFLAKFNAEGQCVVFLHTSRMQEW